MWVFTQHILQISLKQLIWFNGYNSLNFKVHFFIWTCSCTLNIQELRMKLYTAFHQQFKHSSDECQLPTQYLNSVQNIHQLQQHSLPLPARRVTAEPVSSTWCLRSITVCTLFSSSSSSGMLILVLGLKAKFLGLDLRILWPWPWVFGLGLECSGLGINIKAKRHII